MNQFQDYELRGRLLFKNFADKNLPEVHSITFTSDPYSKTDLVYWSGWTITNSEIKIREYSHNKIFNGNTEPCWLIEKTKYDELKFLQKGDCSDSTYINIFPDAIVIWDLTRMNLTEWQNVQYWKTNEKQYKISKQVAYLKLSEASHIFKL